MRVLPLLLGVLALALLAGCGGGAELEPILDTEAAVATHWVAPGGNDTGPGTKTQPWATIRHAAAVVVAGDVIQVQPGTYAGFYVERSGTQAQPILFRAKPGTVTLNATNGRTPDGINLENCSWVTVSGFTVNNMPRTGIRAVAGSHLSILSSTCRDNQKWGILTGFVDYLTVQNCTTSGSKDEHGIYVSNSGDYPVVRRNVSYGNRGCGLHCNADLNMGGDGLISHALFDSNVIYDNGRGGGAGINCDGVVDSVISNNLLYNNHAGGIALFRGNGAVGSRRNRVVNNTVVQASDGRWALNLTGGAIRNTVRNNILLHTLSYRGSLTLSADSRSGFSSDYNVCSGPFSADGDATTLNLTQWRALGHDLHSVLSNAAALFADPAQGNYRPRSGAPALDAGEAAFAPTRDLLGRPRPAGAGVDVGCYEGL